MLFRSVPAALRCGPARGAAHGRAARPGPEPIRGRMAAVSPHPSVPLPAPARALERAAAHVRAGGLLILPTDTVYGIGALASDAAGVSRLLAAKGRDRRMPPPVLVADPAQAFDVVARPPAAAWALIAAFWPGALTLVLDARADLG